MVSNGFNSFLPVYTYLVIRSVLYLKKAVAKKLAPFLYALLYENSNELVNSGLMPGSPTLIFCGSEKSGYGINYQKFGLLIRRA